MESSHVTRPLHMGFPMDKVTREVDFDTSDGLRLHGWQLEAQGGKPRGNVVIVHGFKDYSERYLDFAHSLSEAGYNVFAYDQRGQGRSEGERNYFGSMEDPVDDLDQALKSFKRYDNLHPWYILGHSAGGAVVARYAIDYQENIDGFILTGAFLKRMPALNEFLVRILKVTNLVSPHTGVVDLPDKNFSRDSKIIRQMEKDPLINHGKIPARTAVEILNNTKYIEENLFDIRCPFLVLHGGDDRVNNIEGSREFFRGTTEIAGKELKIYPELFHDLFHEPEKARVEGDIITWINTMAMKH